MIHCLLREIELLRRKARDSATEPCFTDEAKVKFQLIAEWLGKTLQAIEPGEEPPY